MSSDLVVSPAMQVTGSEALLGVLSWKVTILARKVRLAMNRDEGASKFQFYFAIL